MLSLMLLLGRGLCANYSAAGDTVSVSNSTFANSAAFPINQPPTTPCQVLETVDMTNFNGYCDYSSNSSRYVQM